MFCKITSSGSNSRNIGTALDDCNEPCLWCMDVSECSDLLKCITEKEQGISVGGNDELQLKYGVRRRAVCVVLCAMNSAFVINGRVMGNKVMQLKLTVQDGS